MPAGLFKHDAVMTEGKKRQRHARCRLHSRNCQDKRRTMPHIKHSVVNRRLFNPQFASAKHSAENRMLYQSLSYCHEAFPRPGYGPSARGGGRPQEKLLNRIQIEKANRVIRRRLQNNRSIPLCVILQRSEVFGSDSKYRTDQYLHKPLKIGA